MRFFLEDAPEVVVGRELGTLHYVGVFQPVSVDLPLNSYLRDDQSLKLEDEMAENAAGGLGESVSATIKAILEPEEDEPLKRIGAGEIWVVHKVAPGISTVGAAQIHTAKHDGIAIIGEAWFDNKTLENMYRVRAEWALGRVGQIKKEPLDLDAPAER